VIIACRHSYYYNLHKWVSTPTLQGRCSSMIAELQHVYQRERASTPHDSPLRPGDDRSIWHGSGMSGEDGMSSLSRCHV
jgi:hypothetical protein